MKRFILFSLSLCFSISLMAQELVVQSFNYQSTTRDTVIEFPTDDHNKWEKIIMKYSMRCKNALVSPPVSGQTNLGCGEWDYSCNTYITDSTQIDSVFRISPDYVISNFSGDIYEYVTHPTYQYIQSTLFNVDHAILAEDNFEIYKGTESTNLLAGDNNSTHRFQYVLRSEDLLASNLDAGLISGLELDVMSGAGAYKNMKIWMSHFEGNSFNECFEFGTAQQVFYQNVNLDASQNKLRFYNDFMWNGEDDILIDMSFVVDDSNVNLGAASSSSNQLLYATSNNKSIESNASGSIDVEGDFSSISDQITISFWSKGASNLPVNTTILEGTDDSENRQVNIHMPWSNGQIYWDCGGSGNSYDRINRADPNQDYKDDWNHWVFTKDANQGRMLIYLNGTLWHSGTGFTNPIDLKNLRLFSARTFANGYYGSMDDLRMWNKAFNSSDIADLRCGNYQAGDALYDNLVLHLDFDNIENGIVPDLSGNNFKCTIEGDLNQNSFFARDLVNGLQKTSRIPNIQLIRGEYDRTITEQIVLDSIKNSPNKVERYEVQGTDRVLVETEYYYASGDMPILNEDGELIGSKTILPEGDISIGELEHFAKSPMQMEIMSFVTPYGINLDLGVEGKTWTFDVTDFGPVLKGQKRIFLTRGGQWQEEMDIAFEFYEGTPIRNVKSIQQVWPVTSESYGNIINESKFEPRPIIKNADDNYVVTKTTITGHGQEGEFIPRTHYLELDGLPFEWQVWKECSENPVYPQGGTWVYDRAGWCPGMASDTKEYDMTDFLTEGITSTLNYGVRTAAGDSRYIVNSQIIKYGPANFSNDAAVVDIMYPTKKVEHERFNPNCGKPRIVIKNTGSDNLTSVEIVYGVDGGTPRYHRWEGFIPFGETREVELNYYADLSLSGDDLKFYAYVQNPNDKADQYGRNNSMDSDYEPTPNYGSEVVINLKSNNNNGETSYKVYDEYGEVIFQKGPAGIGQNVFLYDTLKNLSGCYKLEITDSGDNGLDWWANPGGGAGFVRIGNVGETYEVIATDFGGFIEYNFTAGEIVSTKDIVVQTNIDIYPNPASNNIRIVAHSLKDARQINITDQTGKQVFSQSLLGNPADLVQDIDLSGLPNGLYFINIMDSNGVSSNKFLKM